MAEDCLIGGGPAVPVRPADGPDDEDVGPVTVGGEGTGGTAVSFEPDCGASLTDPPGYAEAPGAVGITEAVEE